MANTHTSLATLFTDIANAIRGKTASTAQIIADDFATAISGIVTIGQGLAEATAASATAAMIREGETAWVDGIQLTGTIPTYGGAFEAISGGG